MAADIYRVTIVEALDSWLAEGSAGGGGDLISSMSGGSWANGG